MFAVAIGRLFGMVRFGWSFLPCIELLDRTCRAARQNPVAVMAAWPRRRIRI